MIYLLIVLLFLIFLFLSGMYTEYRLWNKGTSPHTNKPWQLFDVDSHGGRGYKDDLGNCIWISYPIDKH